VGRVALRREEYGAARDLYEESLAICRELGNRLGCVVGLEGLAALAVALGQSERAARLFGAAEELREAMGFRPLWPSERAEHERPVTAVRTALGQEAFAAAWTEGRAMSLEDAIAYALAEPSPGEAE
jgi:hypothetical protein